MRVFWRRGYAATSLDQLTRAMGIHRPSLYATFGDKRALFLAALDRYVERHGARCAAALDGTADAREAVRAFLGCLADQFSDAGLPCGCFIGGHLANAEALEPEVAERLAAAASATEGFLRARLERAEIDGELSAGEVGRRARYVASLPHALSAAARRGADRAELDDWIELALCAWPPGDDQV